MLLCRFELRLFLLAFGDGHLVAVLVVFWVHIDLHNRFSIIAGYVLVVQMVFTCL